jgi:hypothetical protein
MSSFLEPESSYTRSISIESTETSQSYNKKWRAPVWAYCRRPAPDENQDHLYCPHYPPEPRPKDYKGPFNSSNSTNMATHLKRHHQILVEKTTNKSHELASQQLRQYYHEVEANSDTTELDAEILRKHLFQAVITEALITLIVVRNLSFCIVEWAEFHTLCQALNKECKGMITTTHSQVKERVREAWAKHKDVVRRVLQSAISRIHISLDIWTSPNRFLLLAIVAHFTSHDQKKRKALLALKQVAGHSSDDQFAILLPVLEDYGIVRKLGAIIADNASANNVLCRLIEAHWGRELGLI